jgi:CheY-like chemotaxis protein
MVVDDDHVTADTLSIILNQCGFTCFTAYDGDEAIERARESKPRAIVMGVIMPRMNGIEAGMHIHDEQPDCKLFFMSGWAGSADLANDARARGYDFSIMAKPIHPIDLVRFLLDRGVKPDHEPTSEAGWKTVYAPHELAREMAVSQAQMNQSQKKTFKQRLLAFLRKH